MTFIELLPYLNNEEKAEEYLREAGILKKFETCIYCNSSSLGRIRRGKIKCYSCKKEWNRRKGSIIESSKISLIQFILFLKLYSYDFVTRIISKEISFSKDKIIELQKIIREEMFNSISVKNDIDKSIAVGQGIKLFLDNNHNIRIVSSEFLLNKSLKYYEISFCRKRDNYSNYYYKFQLKIFREGINKTDELHWFWSQNKNRFSNYKGRNVETMYLFLIEKIYRFNCRETNIYQEIISLIRVA